MELKKIWGDVRKNALAGARYEIDGPLDIVRGPRVGGRTSSIYPQQGAGHFPLRKRDTLSEPRCSAFVV
jgi:hypothetical protein